jgi:hypothetical protein
MCLAKKNLKLEEQVKTEYNTFIRELSEVSVFCANVFDRDTVLFISIYISFVLVHANLLSISLLDISL